MDVFNQGQKVKYVPYLNQGLNKFEDVVSVFTKYSDGGYWIKKIDNKDAFYRQIIDGPYSKKEAEKKAEFWNKFFNYKDIDTARVYSFKELVCEICPKDKEYDQKIKEYIYPEYIYNPSVGMSLMCVLNGDLKVLLNNIHNRDSDFEKFMFYVEELGVEKFTLFDYDIFYLESDIDSNYKASILRKLVTDFHQKPDQLVWLYDELQGFAHTRGVKPFIMPGYISDSKKSCMPLDFEFFKKYSKIKECKKKRRIIFEDLKKCLPDFASDIKADDNDLSVILHTKLVTNLKANKVKDFYVSMDNKNNMVLAIIYPDDQAFIRVEETENCRGNISTNLSIKKFDNSMWLMLYLCKVFAFTHLTITDDFETPCDNEESLKHNILLFLDDRPSYYDKFGFKLSYKDEEKKNQIIKKYQLEDINLFDQHSIEAYDTNMFPSNNLKDIAHTYFEGMNKYAYTCNVLKDITNLIYNQISDCCLVYTVKLSELDWGRLIDNII